MTAAVNTLKIRTKVGEEVIYRKDVTKGFWKKKVLSAFLITNYRVISPDGQMLYFEEIDDVVAMNRRMEKVGNFYAIGPRSYSGSGSGGSRVGSAAMVGKSRGT